MSSIESAPITVLDILQHRANRTDSANNPAFSYSQDGEITASITYAELDRRARHIAASIETICQPGDRILIVYPPGLEYIAAFFGCIYAGLIPIPAIPPATVRAIPRIQRIAIDAGARVALTNTAIVAQTEQFRDRSRTDFIDLLWLTIDSSSDRSAQWKTPRISSTDIAFLQYTSGSTGEPKGVMVTHDNILANIGFIDSILGINENETIVSWLPLYHDMGLIGKMLYPLFAGCHCIHLSPTAFFMRPYRWLKAVSDNHARMTCAPNFAYDLCSRKITAKQKSSLDLSSLAFALNGAEPVRPETLRRFSENFRECGFQPKALMPVYGLAESTLLVTANLNKRPDGLPQSLSLDKTALSADDVVIANPGPGSIEVVSVGSVAYEHQRVVIVEPSSLVQQPDEKVGEVWVRSASVAKGYWGHSSLNDTPFSARLVNEEDMFLRTGDLGFVHDEALYIVGRLKDMMIFNGYNIYPQDIETTVERYHPAFQANGCAAFTIEQDDLPHLVIIQEIDSRQAPLQNDLSAARLRAEIGEQHGIFDIAAILLIKAGGIPRTTSGKIQRGTCQDMFLSDAFSPIWEWRNDQDKRTDIEDDSATPKTEIEHELANIWRDILDVEHVSATDDFFQLGGHSLAAIQLTHRLHAAFGIEIPLTALLENPVLRSLAKIIENSTAAVSFQHAVLPILEPNVADRYQPFPLNDIQQAYWIGRSAHFALGGIAAHVYHEVRIRHFDLPRFNKALCVLIDRHDMLRAIINPDGTQQILESPPEYAIESLDLRGESPVTVTSALSRIRQTLSHQIRVANEWPLFEFRATRVDDVYTHLHISIDLMILDAWSGQTLIHELSQLYQHKPINLAPLKLSFRDYVMAESAFKHLPAYTASLRYWRERLPTLPPSPELPLAKEPESIARPQFIRRQCYLPKAQWSALKSRAAAASVTPSAILLTAFSEVIALWSKSPRFTINLTLFNRLPLHADVNRLIGDFTSLLFLEINAGNSESFLQRTRHVQAQLWQDMEHAAVSGIELLRELNQSDGNLQRGMPIVFTSTLAHESYLPDEETVNILDDDVVYSISQTPQVWLDHQIFEKRGELQLVWDAVEEIFPQGLLDDMFQTYCDLLRHIATEDALWTQCPLDFLPSPQTTIQHTANATDAPFPDSMLHALFDIKAVSGPKNIAVRSAAYTLTYGELRTRALELGNQLQMLNAKPNTLVAVVMEKGWEQVVAVLSILYAGAAYLPLDPSLPMERLHHILEQTDVSIVLTQSHLDGTIAWPTTVQRIFVDQQVVTHTVTALQAVNRSIDDLAYVIYTSGSTGLPKGVMIDHRGAVNTLLDINQRFCLSSEDNVLALSSLSFDLSVFDIFGTLAVGGTIVIPPSDSLRDPAGWLTWIEKEQVTIWNSVPALASMLLEHANAHKKTLPKCLRLFMLSGDWIPLTVSAALQQLLPDAQVFSLGGATEASIWSICYRIENIMPDWKSIPYGKPLLNQRFYVLDKSFRIRPVGVPGELYIGGIGLAKGYWRNQEKTDTSFIHHPQSGERLYKTGDWGRYLPDGNIEFLGREDCQVKIHGHRIELGEIEAALNSHPAITAAIVVTTDGTSNEKRLAAYVVSNGKTELTSELLSDFLRNKLPSYMVPTFFTFAETLPLSANGKIDRNALPKIDYARIAFTESHCFDPIEQEIQRIVEETLRMNVTSPETNLLCLGATSIDLMRISNALFSELNFTLKIDVFLANPTISNLVTAYRLQFPQTESKQMKVMGNQTIQPTTIPALESIEL